MVGNGFVKVTSKGLLQDSHIFLGDQELVATSIKIEIDNKTNMRAKVTIETYAELVDVKALESDTDLIIHEGPTPHE